MKKSFFIFLIKSCAFLILISLILVSVSFLFTEAKTSVWDNFYNHKENTIDILVLGNSHANAALDLDIIDSKLNSTSVSLATKGQNIYQSYYAALEAYNYQSPDVLIIENFLFYERLSMDAFVNQDPTINDYLKRYLSFEGKKIGKVKIKEAKHFFKGNFVENLFPTIKKHSKWTDIEKIKEKLKNKNRRHKRVGTTVLSQKSALRYETKQDFDLSTYNILPDEEKALQQIIDLAKSKGTKKIILLTVPFYKEYRNKIDYKSLDDALKKVLKRNEELTYIDLNSVYPNWNRTYFSNDPVGYNQHLNYKGAIKVSIFISNYLNNAKEKDFNKRETNLPEYFVYNKKYKDTLRAGNKFIGNLESINGKKFKPSSKFEPYKISLGDNLVIVGWMAVKGLNSFDNKFILAFVNNNDEFIYLTNHNQLRKTVRKDVSKYFKEETGIYDDSGFRFNLNSSLLEEGKYKIYMIIETRQGEIIVKDSYKSLEAVE